MIVTYRDSDLAKDHPLTGVLADLRRVDGVERIALHGLGADEVAELLSAGAGHELDQDGLALAGEIATETDGNPFFVGEVLRSLVESGALTVRRGAGALEVDRAAVSSLPESVRDVIERRVDRLGDDGSRGADAGGGDRPLVRVRAARRAGRDARGPAAGSARGGGRRVAAARVDRAGRAVHVRARADQPHALPGARRRPVAPGCTTGSRSRSRRCTAPTPTSSWPSWRCTGGWRPSRSTRPRRPTTRSAPGGERSTVSRRARPASCSATRSSCSAPGIRRSGARR